MCSHRSVLASVQALVTRLVAASVSVLVGEVGDVVAAVVGVRLWRYVVLWSLLVAVWR